MSYQITGNDYVLVGSRPRGNTHDTGADIASHVLVGSRPRGNTHDTGADIVNNMRVEY